MKRIKIKTIKIGKRIVGEDHPCFIIAEAGANFRISPDPKKNFKQALKLIDIAAKAKADAVKFQLYRAEKMYVRTAGYANYLGKKKTIYQIIKEMELPHEWLPELKSQCDKRKIIFLCTPFDEESTEQLEKNGMVAFKTASYTITHLPLLKYLARKRKPIILSTGAANIEDIKRAIEAIIAEGNREIILMQCTAKYPAPLSTINLKVIPELKKIFGVPIGFSDHSREPYVAPLGAVALGASLVEKHFTTDNNLPGPDNSFAILSEELAVMVKDIRDLEKALGKAKKELLQEERELYSFARRYIYAKREIKKGEKFSEENLIILRSGKERKGLEPSRFQDLLGRRAPINLKKNDPLTEKCLDEK